MHSFLKKMVINLKKASADSENYVMFSESADAFPDFVNAYPQNHQKTMVQYVDAVS